MNLNYPLQSKESERKVVKAKFAFIGFIFVLAFIFFGMNASKVGAAEVGVSHGLTIDGEDYNVNISVTGTTFDKNGNGSIEDAEKNQKVIEKTATDGKNLLIYTQGNGIGNGVTMQIVIKNFPRNATALMVVESKFSDSSDSPDADRYNFMNTYTLANVATITNQTGLFVKVGDNYYDISGDRRYSDDACTTQSDDGSYYRYSETGCQLMDNTNVYKLAEIWAPGIDTTGTMELVEAEDATLTANLTYKYRNSGFGLDFFRIVFYKGSTNEATHAAEVDVFFVMAEPIDMIEYSSTSNSSAFYTDYVNGNPTRESRELDFYIPNTVAFDFRAIASSQTEAYKKANYQVTAVSTMYALNRFIEGEDSIDPVPPENINDENVKTYLYTNFVLDSVVEGAEVQDTQKIFDTLAGKYGINLEHASNSLVNNIGHLQMEVDSTGSYYFYLTDIFGNRTNNHIPPAEGEELSESEEARVICFNVTDVKNRSIETIVKKDNSEDIGFGASETFRNTSVKVSLDMEVKTNFEHGVCVFEDKCAEKVILNSGNIKIIRYWRVDVQYITPNDVDGFDEGDGPTVEYASEEYAAAGTTRYLICKGCTGQEIQTFSDGLSQGDAGFGVLHGNGFQEGSNTFEMMIGLNGRYRFYIEDDSGNNTWGDTGDLNIEEYRNPRVEVYGIDKEKPVITFDHDDEDSTSGLTKFEIETYEYYKGIGAVSYIRIQGQDRYNSSGEKVDDGDYIKNNNNFYKIEAIRRYNAITSGSTTTYVRDDEGTHLQIFEYGNPKTNTAGAEPGEITENKIYYKIELNDLSFTDSLAIVLSKIQVREYVYTHANAKSEYSIFTGVNGQYGITSDVTKDRIPSITGNVKNNSSGLRLNDGVYEFNAGEIKYYHYDGETSVCQQIGGTYASAESELTCVNYYLDHGVDFIIEFFAEDAVGNIGSQKVYVDVVDTTAPGFSDINTPIKSTNIIDGNVSCRMEIGQKIGKGTNQEIDDILSCYNVIVGSEYMFEDNVYKHDGESTGLTNINIVNDENHVKLHILDDSGKWVDLSSTTFTPNKTGYYTLKITIFDDSSNSLTVLVSYYVDKRIVLVAPVASEKFYGDNDATFNYCVYVDENNHFDIRFSNNPYSDLSIFTSVYCSDGGTTQQLTKIFGTNDAEFSGNLSRLESNWYNTNEEKVKTEVENNYVGRYNMILGTLNITIKETTSQDPDYIFKLHPNVRVETKYNYSENQGSNKIIGETLEQGDLDNHPLEDDNSFTESNVQLQINQVIITVNANGGSKNYGDTDTGYENYNDDSTGKSYLSGYSVDEEGLKLEDAASVILGVLRRELGEDVGVYTICNYRDIEIDDTLTKAEGKNNDMYVGCDGDKYASSFDFTKEREEYSYVNGILTIESDNFVNYIKSRALYVETNKATTGKGLNTTSKLRDNNHANYVINYVGANYIINPVDLIVQPAPGQRREYGHDNTYDPDPWEIILYGLKEGWADPATDSFAGYTVASPAYNASALDGVCESEDDNSDACYAVRHEANKSQVRSEWNYVYSTGTLTGLKTNDSYTLLRSTSKGETAGSANLRNEKQSNQGGWYLFKELDKDYNIVTGTDSDTLSQIAVMTNGNLGCTYDTTGHLITGVSVDGSQNCKNYSLIYEPYYTIENGRSILTKLEGEQDGKYIYRSSLTSNDCTVYDKDVSCTVYPTSTDEHKKYKVLYEIYRREIIMEFNSALEEMKLKDGEEFIIQYGKRYDFYKDKLFSMNNYYGTGAVTGLFAEDYLFVCYKNNQYDSAEFDGTSGTGCTGNGRYGLTKGDDWNNIGLTFAMHSNVSTTYADSTKQAIPAGAYFIYADIKAEEKRNYNFNYLGGALTIKATPANIVVSSFSKTYGDANYQQYKLNISDEFIDFASQCFADSNIVTGIDQTGLITVECSGYAQAYAFYISNIDSMDTIADNFVGGPRRDRNGSKDDDENGLQDSVGVYTINQGNIASKHHGKYKSEGNQCTLEAFDPKKTTDCIVVSGKEINNYFVNGQTFSYTTKMYGSKTGATTTLSASAGTAATTNGELYIKPATITITVTQGQNKMFGCAYNTTFTGSTFNYTWENGYGDSCVEGTGTDVSGQDFGYEYTVVGDRDYYIAQNGYDGTSYPTDSKYVVKGNPGSETFRPATLGTNGKGDKFHGLNDAGILYRILASSYNVSSGIKYETYYTDASNQKRQGQFVGTYILTLGTVDAPTVTTQNEQNISIKCDVNNNPDKDGAYTCKNYNISYYETKAHSKLDDSVIYKVGGEAAIPEDIKFEIKQRTAYLYTDYDSKIYGSVEPDIAINACTDEDITLGLCETEDKTNADWKYDFGITKYYVNLNSLAKYPWNGMETAGDNDVQSDILSGKLNRQGMDGATPKQDDIKGYYEYDFSAISTNTGQGKNYLLDTDGDGVKNHAVNSEGKTEYTKEGVHYKVEFEIILRRIKIKFISFNKIYGEEDKSTDYKVLVCSPSQEFLYDETKGWYCGAIDSNDRHGLSPTHSTEQYIKDGIITEYFKTEFLLRYKRVLGENVSCGTTVDLDVTLNGFFFDQSGESNTYSVTLKCEEVKIYQTDTEEKSAYGTLAYIEQEDNTLPGYNYEVFYEPGHVAINKRPIIIDPDENQGFVYGDYDNVLTPAITFGTSRGDASLADYGLVSGTGDEAKVLKNIDNFNNGTSGNTFRINDRVMEYDSNTNGTIAYTNPAIDPSTGVAEGKINYVFTDVYDTVNQTGRRMALNRSLGESATDERYNRNVGTYTITLGELGTTEFDNYTIQSIKSVNYTISTATITVFVEENQYKIYGEGDSELRFKVQTEYKVTDSHYAKYNSNILTVNGVAISNIDRYSYSEGTFTKATNGEYIKVEKNNVIVLQGYAYSENADNSNAGNYSVDHGANKEPGKIGNAQVITQDFTNDVKQPYNFDKYCRNAVNKFKCDSNTKQITYEDEDGTKQQKSEILLGYLYVDGYAQKAGVYSIKNGFAVADNQFGFKNYAINTIENVEFKILPRPVGVQIQDVTKTYGQTTDSVSCDAAVSASNCIVDEGILDESANNRLAYNFIVKDDLRNDSNDIKAIFGTNLELYKDGSNGIIGGVAQTFGESINYTEDGNKETKNGSLGVYVSRDEFNGNECLYNGDRYGFCEDVGTYNLRFYGYKNEVDFEGEDYKTYFRPTSKTWDAVSELEDYYYGMYFGYNPNYLVIIVNDSDIALNKDNYLVDEDPSDTVTVRDHTKGLIKETATLTINKKEINIVVNTSVFAGAEIYYIEQNSNAPALPEINNSKELVPDNFAANRPDALGVDTYGDVVWGLHNSEVRTQDKLFGRLSYCNQIISQGVYDNLWMNGLSDDEYCSGKLVFDPKDVNTHLVGYVPIVRDIANGLQISPVESIVDNYENTNYSTTFYPGALRIEVDDTKPVVQVNRPDVYIEANAKGAYSYDCVASNESTTYEKCNNDDELYVVGELDKNAQDTILRWLKDHGYGTPNVNGKPATIIAGSLPTINECSKFGYECTASAYYQLMYGKGSNTFYSEGGIKAGVNAEHVQPFYKQSENVNNTQPDSMSEMINALVSWFGVTAYDLGEVRNGVALPKVFDKYWFVIIENLGKDASESETAFDISKVGTYTVHFYVMDNAGNVSQGNMAAENYYNVVPQYRYNLVGGNYVQSTTGQYLKVGSYLPFSYDELYSKDAEGNYNLDPDGTYMKYEGHYYDIDMYKHYSLNGDVYVEDADGGYIEIHASYYPIKSDSLYRVDEGTYIKDPGGDYLRVGDDYTNVGKLHIIDTTKPEVGTLNLYNGQVTCESGEDCTVEENWKVAVDTYLPENILDEVLLDVYTKRYKLVNGEYVEDQMYGRLRKIPQGAPASHIKHYSWSNQTVWFTITGGRDNSYTEYDSSSASDDSQWSHYYSRDGGLTWFKHSKGANGALIASSAEGAREILIKAVDTGVKITDEPTVSQVTYYTDYYGETGGHNKTGSMNKYTFKDSSYINKDIKDVTVDSIEDKTYGGMEYDEYKELVRYKVGWNVSDSAVENTALSESISQKIYGTDADTSGYQYFRDKQIAYYDVTKPIVSFGGQFGDMIYFHEYGCENNCKNGYTEKFAGVVDFQGRKIETKTTNKFDLNNSILLNYVINNGTGYQDDYTNVEEKPNEHTIITKSGIGSDAYAMNGDKSENSIDIRTAYVKDRIYIIQNYGSTGLEEHKDLSAVISEENAATEINKIIPSSIASYNGPDRSYTIIYSVLDKAGNESQYIARGVVYARLIPEKVDLKVEEPEQAQALNFEKVAEQTYQMNVKQGVSVEDIVNSISVDAGRKKQYLTQTVRYNGQVVSDNEAYNPNIYDGFTTNTPGVYEITYNLQFSYRGELVSAEPVTLIINVEATPPISEPTAKLNYSNIILLISLLVGSLFVVGLGILGKKRR